MTLGSQLDNISQINISSTLWSLENLLYRK
jgi:hypothetical protein